jgi:hypothetical protein
MQGEPQKDAPNPNLVRLNPRKSPKDYWDGYRAGLKAARDGIDRSLEHFDDLIISRASEENGEN